MGITPISSIVIPVAPTSPALFRDGCYRSVLNQSYHVEYDIGFQEPDSGGERVLVEVTHVPWLAVHGHDHV